MSMALPSPPSSNDDSSRVPEDSGQVPQEPTASENAHEMPPEEEWDNKMQQLSEFVYGNLNEGAEENADKEDEESLFVQQDDDKYIDSLLNDASSDGGQKDTDGEKPEASTPATSDARLSEHQVGNKNNISQTFPGGLSSNDQGESDDFEGSSDLDSVEEDYSSRVNPHKRKRSTRRDHESNADCRNPNEYSHSLDDDLFREYLEKKARCEEIRNMERGEQISTAQKYELIQLEAKVTELENRYRRFEEIISGHTPDAEGTSTAKETTEERPAKKRRKPARNAAEAHARRIADI